MNRNFTAAGPDQLWVADITQHWTDQGWLYLAVVLAVWLRMVTGWAMGDSPTADLALDALNMTVANRRPNTGLIQHSDHGSQYTALVFRRTLEQARMLASMASVGDALDNAVSESFFATLQTELLDRHTWPTKNGLKTAIFEYVEVFYNRQRRHSTLEYLTPTEFERRWKSERDQAVA